ncbi:DUF2157 domain-containing protein [Kribbella speibonae]|uniref:DUF2157 domain-containing protein n=1 Tax=Kribbella speibonae TaxID=1572660 RepID=A0A4V2M358_9ACTN|nr:DUF2157 domain-containing protein [Kribbella speibonae]TCC30762.1 DUF2157 domain-containing protein [Kribbella speibonae]
MRRSSASRRQDLPRLIAHWADAGLISADQAVRLRADVEQKAVIPAAPQRERSAVLVEALAYLGGTIVLIAAGLLGAQYWDALPDLGRLALVGGASALLVVAGSVVPRRLGEASVRLRSVLWLLATAAAAGFAALFADIVLELHGVDIAIVSGVTATVVAAGLWSRLRTVAQQAAVFVALMVTTAAVVAKVTDDAHLPGLAVWGVGVVWFLLGVVGVTTPRRPVLALSALGILVGAVMTLPTDAGMVLALVTVVAIVVLAVRFRDLMLLGVGALGALNILPAVVTEWFPGDLAPPLVLLVFGGLLVAAALYTARRRRP